ncbi:hypothetical protein BFP77_11195 [Maribacter sp. 4U21]|nr:hypothetical protein BFP77_11195 [Maribacter sp. 4U21]
MARDHALFNAQGQYPCEGFLEDGLREQLPRTAYRTVPGKFLVDTVTDKIEDVQAHRTMVDKLAVADDVPQIAHQTQLEENDRVDALLAALPIISLGQPIEEIQIDGTLQTPVEIVLGYALAQLEMGEQLFLVILFSLHT